MSGFDQAKWDQEQSRKTRLARDIIEADGYARARRFFPLMVLGWVSSMVLFGAGDFASWVNVGWYAVLLFYSWHKELKLNAELSDHYDICSGGSNMPQIHFLISTLLAVNLTLLILWVIGI